MYCGRSKPEDADEFLTPFIQETKFYVNNGIHVADSQYNVLIDGFILDAPAKAYILGVKCHSGYYSCTKCEIKGIYRDCVCFPGEVQALRTDDQFEAYDVYKEQGYQQRKTILSESHAPLVPWRCKKIDFDLAVFLNESKTIDCYIKSYIKYFD